MTFRVHWVADGSPEFPVQAFFNAVSDNDFVRVIAALVRRVGFGAEYAICTFPGDLDPNDPPLEGVRFSLFQDSIDISEQKFFEYLKAACKAHIAKVPSDKTVIESLLRSF